MSIVRGFLLIFSLASLFYSHSLLSAPTAESIIEQLQLRESQLNARDMPGWRKLQKIVLWGDQQTANDFKTAFPALEFIASNDIAEVKAQLKHADGYIGYCIGELFTESVNVSYIQSLAVGVEGCVNAKAIQDGAITLTNAQRLSAPGIADHAIGLMYSLVRRLDQYGARQAAKTWDRQVASGDDKVWEIAGRTMLVVGLGGIGTETARRAHGLGMRVIATRNSRKQGPDFVEYVGLSDELLTLVRQADVVVNTVPLTDKTHGLFDKNFFKAMPNHAYFINIARGKSVVTEDLIEALNLGELAGAGLDVTDPEPLPEQHPLWHQPRVIITPHIAYRSEKLRERVRIIARENLKRYLQGEKLLSVVNIQRGY